MTTGADCPGCGLVHDPDDVFCEVSGVNIATGEVPAETRGEPPTPGGASIWTALIDADRSFFDANLADCGGEFVFPGGLVHREVPLQGDEVSVGRRHDARGVFPDIDLSDPVDPGASRQHAVLRRQPDDTWVLIDTGSSNGTRLNDDAEPLKPGETVRLHHGDRIRLGLFTVITVRDVRKATT